jgi:hypothetical protein
MKEFIVYLIPSIMHLAGRIWEILVVPGECIGWFERAGGHGYLSL